jgi:hypothetical protein
MANQIVVSAGAKVRNLSGVLTATSGVVSFLPIDVSLGIPQLDVNGKILVSQLPNSVMEYKGTWNASTNTPTLVNGTGNQGDVYLCNVAGTVDFGAGAIAFVVGDQVIYSGSIWQRASGATGTVTSVGITESGDSLNITGSPITTSGTINIGFNGTNLQYVNGAGNLTTFPILTGFVPYTGATTSVDLGAFLLTASGVDSVGYTARGSGTLSGYLILKQGTTFLGNVVGYNSINANSTKYTFISDVDGTNYKQASFELGSLTNNTARTYTLPNANGTIALTSDIPILTGYVPYTGATANVDLGTFNLTADVITGATGSFTSNGGSDTFAINHSSGAGIALNITKGGNGEGLYINKTSGSGNAATIIGTLNATTLVKSGGTSSQFLKADGTVDSSTYALDSAVVHNTGNETVGGTKTFSDATKNNGGIFLQNASSNSLAGYMNLGGLTNGLKFTSGGGISNTFTLPSATGYTFTFPNATGTIALTSDLTGYLTAVTATSPLSSSGGTTPNITIAQATTSTNGYLSSTDWNTFNLKQPQLNGTGFVKASGTTISYDNSTYALDSAVVHNTGTETIGGAKTFSTFTKFDGGVILKNNVSASLAGYVGLSAYSASGNKGINIDFDTYSNSFYFSGTLPYQYTFPAASGTIALVGGSGVGTVTSVAALTIGTSGTDLSSTVANSTTTPVITLNVPTASATNRGALSSADWSTFNSKQGTITLTTTGTSGAATFSSNTLNIPNYGSALSSYVPYSGATTNVSLGAFWINTNFGYFTHGSTGQDWLTRTNNTTGNYEIVDWGSTVARVSLTASGNLGLGVTPSAWSVGKAIEIGTIGNGLWNASASDTRLMTNVYYDGTLRYGSTSSATMMETGSGFIWRTAPSGTAGNAITFTQAMTLTAAGRLLIGTPTEATYMLDVNGTGRFTGALSGTSATFSGILAESKTADGIIQTIGGNLTKANIYQFSTGGLGGAVFNIGHNFYYDGTNYGQGNAAKPGWVISSNINADSFAIARAAAGSTSAPTGVLSFASTGAATFSDSIKTGTPSGGTAKPWKLGQDTSTLYSATRTIQVEIDGGTYYLLAVKSTDL